MHAFAGLRLLVWLVHSLGGTHPTLRERFGGTLQAGTNAKSGLAVHLAPVASVSPFWAAEVEVTLI